MKPPRLVGPWLLLPAGAALAVAAVALDRVRLGGYLLAATLLAAAVLRALLPARAAGAIAVRSRGVDILLLTGSALLAAALAKTLKLD